MGLKRDLKIKKKQSLQQAEMQLQGLIKNLEYRLQKTDQATIEAKEIRDELHKLRKKNK